MGDQSVQKLTQREEGEDIARGAARSRGNEKVAFLLHFLVLSKTHVCLYPTVSFPQEVQRIGAVDRGEGGRGGICGVSVALASWWTAGRANGSCGWGGVVVVEVVVLPLPMPMLLLQCQLNGLAGDVTVLGGKPKSPTRPWSAVALHAVRPCSQAGGGTGEPTLPLLSLLSSSSFSSRLLMLPCSAHGDRGGRARKAAGFPRTVWDGLLGACPMTRQVEHPKRAVHRSCSWGLRQTRQAAASAQPLTIVWQRHGDFGLPCPPAASGAHAMVWTWDTASRALASGGVAHWCNVAEEGLVRV